MSSDWIDGDGFRANVGIILVNDDGRLMLGRRTGARGWQFPQGGMLHGEDAETAMYRELHEEVGLEPGDVELLGVTRDWLRYRLPDKYVRKHSSPLCIGQKQRWFMLRLAADPSRLRFDLCTSPEFDRARWVRYWRPVNEVIYFKRRVYVSALHELGVTAYPFDRPAPPRWWPKRWKATFEKDMRRIDAELAAET